MEPAAFTRRNQESNPRQKKSIEISEYFRYSRSGKALSQEEEFLNSLSKDIWLLVLSKEQEDFLTISREEMGVIAQYRTGKEG